MTVPEARWRLLLGLGQMVAAAAVPILWLAGVDLRAVFGTFLLACVLTAISIALWGGFWSRR
jgi:hypothetical protein